MGVDGEGEPRAADTSAAEQSASEAEQGIGRPEAAAATAPKVPGQAGGGRPAMSVPPQRAAGSVGGGPAPAGPGGAGPGGDDEPVGDTELVSRIRAGDTEAYEELYRRHADAVRRYARTCCRDTDTADDLTNEVFARTLQAVQRGKGPTTAVRAYLLTSVRHAASAWSRSAKREQLVEDFALFAVSAVGGPASGEDTVELGADVRAMHEAEQSMVVRAFRTLPERWQAVLWHTTVEDSSPRDVAPILGLTANATAVLAHRAREGLKQAYLQAHVSQSLTAGGDCARYADRLGAYARGGLRMRAERGLRKHLDECARCRTAALEVKDVNERLGALLPVAVIGWFAATYSVKAAGGVLGGAGAGLAAGSAAAASGKSGAGAGAVSEGLGAPAKAGIAASAVAAAAAATALVLALAGDPKPDAPPQARPSVAPSAPAAEPAPAPPPSEVPVPQPEEAPPPAVTPSPSPAPPSSAPPTPTP
ncbi:sigma-70 family RNA polymerase sigma factor, partial [Streptomyces alkaliterrae]